jgi:ABC-type Fe3+ transport system permease subunit
MNHQVTHEILWNAPVAFRIFLYGMLLPLAAAFVYEGMRWYRIVSLGQPVDRLDQPGRRFWLLVRDTAGQGNVIRETWGSLHYAFYVGFLALFIGTTIIFSMTRSPRRPDFSVFPVTWWA